MIIHPDSVIFQSNSQLINNDFFKIHFDIM